MTPGTVGGTIRIPSQPAHELRLGEVVVLHVIKRLDAGKWAVGIAGRVYPAASDLPLEPGSTLRARVGAAGGRLVLTIVENVPDAVSAALQRAGLPTEGDTAIIARAFARSGLPILGEMIQKVKTLLSRSDMEPRRWARAAATLVDRGIDPASPGGRALLPVLGFGEKGGADPRRYRGRPLPQDAAAAREFVGSLAEDPGDHPSALQAYNHLRGRSQSWVVIPFVFASGQRRIVGTIKILFDTYKARPLALTLSTETATFHLPLHGRQRLSIYCETQEQRSAVANRLDSLRAKFHNMGLEVDDTVNDGDAFDGFSPVGEGESPPSVDTVG